MGVLSSAEKPTRRDFPGCVGLKGAAIVKTRGQTWAAWISDIGLLMSNASTYEHLSSDIDFDSIGGDRSQWSLHYDESLDALYMGTDQGTFYVCHMLPEHQKESGQPRWTGPHPGTINDMVSANLAGTWHLWAASSAGLVSTQRQGGGDQTMELIGRKIREEGVEFSVLEGELRHDDFGAEAVASVQWTTADDDAPDHPMVATQQVSMAGARKHQFDVDQGGEWHQWKITQAGRGLGRLLRMMLRGRAIGEADIS